MKNKVLLPIILAFFTAFGVLIGMFFNFPMRYNARTEKEHREEKLKQIISYIDFEYVDEVNTDSLLDLTITDLLRRLDPHSTYIPLNEVAANEESIRGNFEGIGVEFRMYKDTLTVVSVIDNGPSDKAGIKAGDRILQADETILYGTEVNSNVVVNTLKGERGSVVNLSVYNPQTLDVKTIKVKRGTVPIYSVQASFMVTDSIGFIKLVRFSETTVDEVRSAIKSLKNQGAQKLILDLRDNPGGLLTAAKTVSDQFLSKGKLIVFTKDRAGERNELWATARGAFETGDLAVLINEGSASASEIVAGAVQDNDRGVIIGRKSFGKGLVQEEITLDDGSRMRLTTQRYYTPTGRSIQKPYKDYNPSFLNGKGYITGETPHQDSIIEGIGTFTTPLGRSVFGGGGITPDVVVSFDTSKTAAVLYHVGALTNFNERAFTYVDTYRSDLSKFTPNSFINDFEVDSIVLQNFFKEDIDKVERLDSIQLDLFKIRVKSYIGYNMYGEEVYLQVYFKTDPITRKALEIFKSSYDIRYIGDSIP